MRIKRASNISIQTDVVIIGAGPVGLFSVFACGMMRLKTVVIDALDMIGGQCAALYPEKPIYDIPGFSQLTAQALVDQLQEQITPFKPAFYLNQKALTLKPQGETHWLVNTTHHQFEAKAVIIAAGAGAFGPNRPPLEGLAELEGKSVFYHIRTKEIFRDKRIVIAGGGDSAVDWAIALTDLASQVSVVHRRPQFRAAPENLRQLHQLVETGRIELVVPYQLKDVIKNTEGSLQAVQVATLEGEEKRLDADILLPFFGLSYDLGPLSSWGLTLKDKHIAVDFGTCETNLKGVYAIGDIATYPHKRKLILTGFAEAAQAAHAIRAHLFPDAAFHFEYSTTSGVPKL